MEVKGAQDKLNEDQVEVVDGDQLGVKGTWRTRWGTWSTCWGTWGTGWGTKRDQVGNMGDHVGNIWSIHIFLLLMALNVDAN